MPVSDSLPTARQLFEWACMLLDLALASYIVICFGRRERAGRTLLDLGRFNENRSTLMIGFGVFQLILGFLGVLLGGIRDYRWSFFTFLMLQGVNNIIIGLQRFLICEEGILSSERLSRVKLYRWNDILYYDIERGKLRLKLRDILGERWITCRPRVRLDYLEELDTVLASRCQKLRLPVGV